MVLNIYFLKMFATRFKFYCFIYCFTGQITLKMKFCTLIKKTTIIISTNTPMATCLFFTSLLSTLCFPLIPFLCLVSITSFDQKGIKTALCGQGRVEDLVPWSNVWESFLVLSCKQHWTTSSINSSIASKHRVQLCTVLAYPEDDNQIYLYHISCLASLFTRMLWTSWGGRRDHLQPANNSILNSQGSFWITKVVPIFCKT